VVRDLLQCSRGRERSAFETADDLVYLAQTRLDCASLPLSALTCCAMTSASELAAIFSRGSYRGAIFASL